MGNLTETKLFPENETIAYYEGILNEIETVLDTRKESVRKITLGIRAMYQNSNGNFVTRKELGRWHNPNNVVFKKDVWEDVIDDGYFTAELLRRAVNLGYFETARIKNRTCYRSTKDTIEEVDVLRIAKLKNISHNEARTYKNQIAAYNAKYYADKTPVTTPASEVATTEPVNQETTDMHTIILQKYDDASKEVDNITTKLEEILKSDEAKELIEAVRFMRDEKNKDVIEAAKTLKRFIDFCASENKVLDLFEWKGENASTQKEG